MHNTSKADLLLRSSNIFTATDKEYLDGYIAVKNDTIVSIGAGNGDDFISDKTRIFDLGDKTVCPGFSDVHCFFMGYLMKFVGINLSTVDTLEKVSEYISSVPKHKEVILAHGLQKRLIPLIPQDFGSSSHPGKPIILFTDDGETCWMNELAMSIYEFTPENCYPEAYWRLFKSVLIDTDFVTFQYLKYMKMLNGKGITSVKEMGFDDYYGFTDILKKLEDKNLLTMRVHFMSQPVGADANINYGIKMKELFNGNFVHFSGYNRMTDGSISQMCGDLKKPYCNSNTLCEQHIDYDAIKKEVLVADAAGFRFSLHAQGDAAICKSIDIFDQCKKNKDGRLLNRHAITDLEFSDPSDLERMGKLGVIAEIYPQIQSIANRNEKIKMIHEKIGAYRGEFYWNRRKMVDSNVLISCGTDFPLLAHDIPESIYNACGMFFPDEKMPYNSENALTLSELLKAWSYGGAYNLGHEDILGTLENNKLADIVIFDRNLAKTPLENIRDAKVIMTIFNGEIVHPHF